MALLLDKCIDFINRHVKYPFHSVAPEFTAVLRNTGDGFVV